MKLFQTITTALITLLSLMTATSLVTHETGIDKLPKIKYSTGDLAHIEIIPETMRGGHAHAEYNPGHSLINGFARHDPTAPPRTQFARKHMMQRVEPRGRHAFDNYCLPVIS